MNNLLGGGEIQYGCNPALKKGECKEFYKPWSGPYVINKVL